MSNIVSDTHVGWLTASSWLFLFTFLESYLGNEVYNKTRTDWQVLLNVAEYAFSSEAWYWSFFIFVHMKKKNQYLLSHVPSKMSVMGIMKTRSKSAVR